MAGRAKRQVGVGVADYGRDRGARWWGACGFHLLATHTDGDTELSRADAVARGPSLRCCLPRPRSRAVPVLLCRAVAPTLMPVQTARAGMRARHRFAAGTDAHHPIGSLHARGQSFARAWSGIRMLWVYRQM